MVPPLSPLVRRTLAAGTVGAGALLSARVLLQPKQQTASTLLDWEAVRRIAHQRAGPRAGLPATRRSALAASSDEIAAGLAPLMADVTEHALLSFPRFVILDRHDFVDVNIQIAGRLLAPVDELRATLRDSRATTIGRGLTSRYVGVLFGIMSQRVLGQYDPVLSIGTAGPASSPALYLVEPNLEEFADAAGAPLEPLRRWLILHELTHAWQFGEHPWLRDHLVGMMERLIRSSLAAAVAADGRAAGARELIERLPAAVRGQLRSVAQVQAVMSVLEGYSNFVMHRVGRAHLERFDELEAAFAHRRRQRTPVERLVLAVTGVNMKLRQYEVGERFCEAVTAAGGLSLLNRVWEGVPMMPSAAELKTPSLWVARARR